MCLRVSFVSSSLCPPLVFFCYHPVLPQSCSLVSYHSYHNISLAWREEFISLTVHRVYFHVSWIARQTEFHCGHRFSPECKWRLSFTRGTEEQRSASTRSTAKQRDDRKLRHKRGWLNLIKQRLFVCAARSSEHQKSTKKGGRGKATRNIRWRCEPYTRRVPLYFCSCVVLFSKQKLKLHLFFFQNYHVISKKVNVVPNISSYTGFVIWKADECKT